MLGSPPYLRLTVTQPSRLKDRISASIGETMICRYRVPRELQSQLREHSFIALVPSNMYWTSGWFHWHLELADFPKSSWNKKCGMQIWERFESTHWAYIYIYDISCRSSLTILSSETTHTLDTWIQPSNMSQDLWAALRWSNWRFLLIPKNIANWDAIGIDPTDV